MKLFLFMLLVPLTSFAWTLNTNFGASFKDNNVKVFIDGNTTCVRNNLTVYDLEDLVKSAAKNYWNTVPTSNLRLEPAGFTQGISNINTGILCSPTDEVCLQQANLIPAVDEIVIACNENNTNFGSDNILAVTIPNKFSGKKITGSIIIINNVNINAKFGQLSRNDKIAVLAHEIGHAIGLGHSKDDAALMYYRTVNLRKKLGQDDIDGVSWLYPVKGDLYGLFPDGIAPGACGTISTDDDPKGGPPFFQMTGVLLIFILCFEILKLIKRSKRSSTL